MEDIGFAPFTFDWFIIGLKAAIAQYANQFAHIIIELNHLISDSINKEWGEHRHNLRNQYR